MPFASVTTVDEAREPAVVVKLTGTPTNAAPFTSSTDAVIVVEPPREETDAGFARRITRPTAAVPSAILIAPSVPVVAPPEIAVIVAVPFAPLATKVTDTRPLTSVDTSEG